jgi:diguanylate cyclase (GGDEF)-like protein
MYRRRFQLAATGVDPASARVLRVGIVAIGTVSAVLGCMVLIGGWTLGLAVFKSVLPGLATMKVNTALGITALGIGLAITGRDGDRRGALAGTAAGVATALGLVTLAEYAFDWNAGIDQLIFRDSSNPAHPGRPALATAISMTLYGAALLCVDHPRLHLAKSATGVAGTLVSWAAVNGHIFGGLQSVPLFSSVAVHTAIIGLFFGFGVLAAEPTFWPIRTALERGAGGIVCRVLLPIAVFAPPSLGWLLERASILSIYPAGFRWALYSAVASLGSVWVIMMLARRIAAMEAERIAATELSRHDALTGLANRRAFDAFLLESFNLARRHRHALSLVLLDVDRFKSYNDAYGHPAGDELLKALGALLISLGRETDLVARIGGEEFAVVLPETDLPGAEALAERIRTVVERATDFRRAVTVSLGIAAATQETSGPAMLLHDCDAALYQAKRAGRNRVSISIAA